VGENDSRQGTLNLYADATNGGMITLYTAANYDDSIDSYQIRVYEDDLTLGPNSDYDALKLDSSKNFHITAGSLNVGADDTTAGLANVYGGGIYANGGKVRLYNSATYDGSIDYYEISACYNADTFYLSIGPDNDLDAILLKGSVAHFTVGNVYFGVSDSARGMLHLLGGSTGDGGAVRFTNSADADDFFEHYEVLADDNGDFVIRATTVSAYGPLVGDIIRYYGNGDWVDNIVIGGGTTGAGGLGPSVIIGKLSGTEFTGGQGSLHLTGGMTGDNSGGCLSIYTPADYNGTITRYDFYVYHDELHIGPNTDRDALKLVSTKDLYITAGSLVLPASEYVNFGGTQGSGGYGVRDNAGTMEYKDSGGSWTTFTSLSDIRFKTGIQDLPKDLGLKFVLDLRPRRFFHQHSNRFEEGFIAQEIEETLFKLQHFFCGWDRYDNGTQFLRYERFVVPLVKAVQEQQKVIDELKAELDELKKAA
jgi:hypothetical protein